VRKISSVFVLMFICVGLALSIWTMEKNEREPANAGADGNLKNLTENIRHRIETASWKSIQDCDDDLLELNRRLYSHVRPEDYPLQEVQNNGSGAIQDLWLSRLAVREKLKALWQDQIIKSNDDDVCVFRARETLRYLRYMEEYIGEVLLHPGIFDAEKDSPLIDVVNGQFPSVMLSPSVQDVRVRSGDILISRGEAYTSAAIARIGEEDAQFSHLAFIYFKGGKGMEELPLSEALKRPDVLILEAHIEIGSTIRKLKAYFDEGKGRIMHFRFQDPVLAHRAAEKSYQFIMGRVEKSRKQQPFLPFWDVNHSVPYDFHMDLSNTKEVFCSEVGYLGFHQVGVEIPLFMSRPQPRNDLIQRLGVTSQHMFAPGDLEVDPRFEQIGEYKDYRKVNRIRMKDVVLTAMYGWMEKKSYRLKTDLMKEALASLGWLLRHMEFRKEDLPKNMNVKVINTVLLLDDVAETLEKRLIEVEQAYQKQMPGYALLYLRVLAALEAYRREDEIKWIAGKKSDFHFYLSPPGLNK